MGKIDSTLIEMEANTQNAQKVKNLVLDKLLNDGVITKEQHETYCIDSQVIIIKRSWFERWWKKIYSGNNDDYMFKYVKF